MYYLIPVFLAPFLGRLIAHFTKEELEEGKKYFVFFEIVLLLSLVVLSFLDSFSWLFFIGLVLAYLLPYEYLYFGFLSLSLEQVSLLFLYALPFGSLEDTKTILLSLGVFFVVVFVSYLVSFDFSSLTVGALLMLVYKKLVSLRKT